MRIDNNYTQYRQPNFGRLKSITYHEHLNPDIYPVEFAKLLKTVKESKAFNDFFQKYDVDVDFDTGKKLLSGRTYVRMTLNTAIPKTEDNDKKLRLVFEALWPDDRYIFLDKLLKNLTRAIKNTKSSDLKYKLYKALKDVEKKEKENNLQQKARAEIADITNSFLTQNSPEESKKKTFFEKLFGWLK